MKRLCIILSFLSFSYAQDIVWLKQSYLEESNRRLKTVRGKVEIIEAEKTVKVAVQGTSRVEYFNFDDVKEILDKDGARVWSYTKYRFDLDKEKELVDVVVNITTGKIHNTSVLHGPDSTIRKEYDSKQSAINDGYRLCGACFDLRPKITDLGLERQLTDEAKIAIQNRYEIMYEHEKLESLSNMMNLVLERWPEPLKGYEYRLQIIRDDSPNAFALAGGNLYLTTGLIDIIENNEEFEAVLAHEIAHVEKRHTLRNFKIYQKKLEETQGLTIFLSTIAAASGNINVELLSEVTKLMAEFSALLAIKGYSREFETEADIFANQYLEKNGKDEKYLMTVFDRLASFSKTRLGYIPTSSSFSDHPSLLKRIRQVQVGEFFYYENPLQINLKPKGIFNPMWRGVYKDGSPPVKNTLKQKEKFVLDDIEDEFLTFTIESLFMTESIEASNKTDFYLFGSIENNHWKNYTVTDSKLYFSNNVGQMQLNGLQDINILAGTKSEFSGKISLFNWVAEGVENELKNGKVDGYINVTPLVYDEKQIKALEPWIKVQISSHILFN